MPVNKKNTTAHASLASLETEASAEAFTFDLGSKVIEFPAPTDMSWNEANDFMSLVQSENVDFETLFSTWLAPDDFAALRDANLTLGQTVALMKLVSAHYESVFGLAGN